LLADTISAETRRFSGLLGHIWVADDTVVADILVTPYHTRQARQPCLAAVGVIRIARVEAGPSLGADRAIGRAVLVVFA